MHMFIEYRLPSVADYKRLRNSVGWRNVDDHSIEKALQNSLYSVVALESDAVIGFGRVVGDAGLYYYVQDLIVHPDFQAKGVGQTLMNELILRMETYYDT